MNSNTVPVKPSERYERVANFEGDPFGDVFFDRVAEMVVFEADCPPFGRMIVGLNTESIELEIIKKPVEGKDEVRVQFTKTLNLVLLDADLQILAYLYSTWKTVWPNLLRCFTEERRQFDLDMNFQSEDQIFSISLPQERGDQPIEGWLCTMGVQDEGSGSWVARFNLDGEITHSQSVW